jgi:hypothetical protein
MSMGHDHQHPSNSPIPRGSSHAQLHHACAEGNVMPGTSLPSLSSTSPWIFIDPPHRGIPIGRPTALILDLGPHPCGHLAVITNDSQDRTETGRFPTAPLPPPSPCLAVPHHKLPHPACHSTPLPVTVITAVDRPFQPLTGHLVVCRWMDRGSPSQRRQRPHRPLSTLSHPSHDGSRFVLPIDPPSPPLYRVWCMMTPMMRNPYG